ncbi:hypothetical protein J4Q44_G00325990 [Coregonus suidteri]|uniref:Uncharacterized protein n=1 Tax=Coregonus suidteri TaxID=861788 RepID=A0AAN8KSA2_9TELE
MLCVLQALGGLSYQDLYQRILSAASSAQAQDTCFAAAGLVFITGVPSVIIGAVAASTDWNQTAYGLPAPFARGEAGKVLPLALQYLTPPWVSVVGIGAVAAAVMSSMDSVLLSSASMFSHNIYKSTLRAQASDRECVWVIRLICVLHCRCANGYGATAGYLVAVTLRLLSGEPLLRLPTVLLFPGWREEGGVIRQYFPFRTLVMLVSLVCIPQPPAWPPWPSAVACCPAPGTCWPHWGRRRGGRMEKLLASTSC